MGEQAQATLPAARSRTDGRPLSAERGSSARHDLYDTLAGQTLVVGEASSAASDGVLANDTDADGDVLVAMLDSPPDIGTVQLAPNGSFTFTPAPGFTGNDTFTYRASDGTDVSNAATVTVRVSAPATIRPIAQNDAYQVVRTPGFTILSVPAATGLLENDFDQQGDALRVVPESSPGRESLRSIPTGRSNMRRMPIFRALIHLRIPSWIRRGIGLNMPR